MCLKFAKVPIYYVIGCLRKQFLSICRQNTLLESALVLNIHIKTIFLDILTPGTSVNSFAGLNFKILQNAFLRNLENRFFSLIFIKFWNFCHPNDRKAINLEKNDN